MNKVFCILLALIICSFFVAGSVYAEQGDSTTVEESISKYSERAKRRMANIEYIEPTFKNLSKLYWTMGMFDPVDDPEAVTKYIMINECDIYHDFYHDDFEWRRIHEMTTQYLSANRASFPRHFEFVQELHLGRYDIERETFEVLTDNVTAGTRRFETYINFFTEEVCGMTGMIDGYPRNIILSLSRPFVIRELNVPAEKAKDYLMRTRFQQQAEHRDQSRDYLVKNYERMAYLRIRVRMIKFIETQTSRDGEQLPVIFASMDGYDVYEDRDREHLLFTTSMF